MTQHVKKTRQSKGLLKTPPLFF